ncbi:MAG: alanine racemase [Bacteroidota bacterium]
MEKPTRPTLAQIDLQAIAFNLGGVRKRVGAQVKIMGVVKANAYGHGLIDVARFIEKRHVDYLGVAFAEEGVRLREAGIRKPIHVFTVGNKAQTELCAHHDLEPTISSSADVEIIETIGKRFRKTIPAHLKIDTGMNRIGVKVRELDPVLLALGKSKRIDVKGMFTHFANADERDKSFAQRQLGEFVRAIETARHIGLDASLTHCANSAAILDLPESRHSMVRCGIMMYGYYPSRETSESVPLKPAMTLKTSVSLVKQIDPGESVSYGRRFIARRRTTIATLPIGYADGFSRLLTGKSVALINGQRHPVVGTICMDQCMVDCGMNDVSVGDEAILVGRQGDQQITAWDLADRMGTIPYEICCGISARVPRVYTNS